MPYICQNRHRALPLLHIKLYEKILLPSEVQTDAYYVVLTAVCVSLDKCSGLSSNGAVLIECVHIAKVDVEELTGVDTYTKTHRVV